MTAQGKEGNGVASQRQGRGLSPGNEVPEGREGECENQNGQLVIT